jgi:hypothetical protein
VRSRGEQRRCRIGGVAQVSGTTASRCSDLAEAFGDLVYEASRHRRSGRGTGLRVERGFHTLVDMFVQVGEERHRGVVVGEGGTILCRFVPRRWLPVYYQVTDVAVVSSNLLETFCTLWRPSPAAAR